MSKAIRELTAVIGEKLADLHGDDFLGRRQGAVPRRGTMRAICGDPVATDQGIVTQARGFALDLCSHTWRRTSKGVPAH